jgi:hypothetical protein
MGPCLGPISYYPSNHILMEDVPHLLYEIFFCHPTCFSHALRASRMRIFWEILSVSSTTYVADQLMVMFPASVKGLASGQFLLAPYAPKMAINIGHQVPKVPHISHTSSMFFSSCFKSFSLFSFCNFICKSPHISSSATHIDPTCVT